MSEVKRWEPRNTVVGYDMQPLPDGSFVLFYDFDRVIAERDAALEDRDYCKRVAEHNKEIGEQLQQRLTAAEEELDQCQSMALMIEEKEWAEYVGKGSISSRVELAFTQLHNELSESRQGLTAADERAHVLEGLLRLLAELSGVRTSGMWERVVAALKPAEGGGDEAI